MRFRDSMLQAVRPEFQSDVRKALAEAENFFKHADRDPEAALEFIPRQTELFMLEAVEAYEKLTSEKVPLFNVYRFWFLVEVGKDLVVPEVREALRKSTGRAFNTLSREAFLADALPAAMSMGVHP